MKQIAEIPIALVEIRELAHRLEEKRVTERENPLDQITGADLEYVEITAKIKTLIDSSIQAIRLEGLAGLVKRNGITREEKGVIEDALYHYHGHCWSTLPISKQEAVTTMIALFEALQVEAPPDDPETELIAQVNPVSELKTVLDRNMEAAKNMPEGVLTRDHFVVGPETAKAFGWDEVDAECLAPEYPGISERIDREIDLVTQSKVQRCRVCQCTDDDCRQCFEKTGRPCYWIEPGLCSACALEGESESQASGVVAEG